MSATIAQLGRCALVRATILKLLGARRGGTTRAEMEDILGITRDEADYALHRFTRAKAVDRHGRNGDKRCSYRYTLPGDPLTRTIEPCRPEGPRGTPYLQRAGAILAGLVGRSSVSRAALVRLLGLTNPRALERDLRRLIAAQKVERVGGGNMVRYRLPRVVRLKITAPS